MKRFITVRDLLKILASADDLDDPVLVDVIDERNPMELKPLDDPADISYGFIIGKVDLE